LRQGAVVVDSLLIFIAAMVAIFIIFRLQYTYRRTRVDRRKDIQKELEELRKRKDE
jgi:hypothetical protein